MIKTLKVKDKEVQNQTQYNKIRKEQYNERYEHIKTEIPIEYLQKQRRGESQRLIARGGGNLEGFLITPLFIINCSTSTKCNGCFIVLQNLIYF